METRKITLHLSKPIVELARKMAKEENTSITQMFSEYILARYQMKSVPEKPAVSSLIRSIIGTLQVPKDWDYKVEMANLIDEKYCGRS